VQPSIARRLAEVPVLPESRAALEQLVAHDWASEDAIEDRLATGTALEQIYRGLGGEIEGLQPFLTAWLLLRAALLHLDHLQDDDAETLLAKEQGFSSAERYNLVFTYYALTMSLLDDLDDAIIPCPRFRRLTHLWNISMLIAGSGQQRDLRRSGPQDSVDATLEHYLQTIDAKAGAVYALGLGGAAVLATDDVTQVDALSFVGRIFGTLLQFSDDVLDAPAQSSPMLTLPQVYAAAVEASGLDLPSHTLTEYWNHLYRSYLDEVQRTLTILPDEVQKVVIELFRRTFDT
jgi:hypothetical protein